MSVRGRAPPPKEAQPSLFDHLADRPLLHVDHSFRLTLSVGSPNPAAIVVRNNEQLKHALKNALLNEILKLFDEFNKELEQHHIINEFYPNYEEHKKDNKKALIKFLCSHKPDDTELLPKKDRTGLIKLIQLNKAWEEIKETDFYKKYKRHPFILASSYDTTAQEPLNVAKRNTHLMTLLNNFSETYKVLEESFTFELMEFLKGDAPEKNGFVMFAERAAFAAAPSKGTIG